MALKACKECGTQISDKATQCPHCGAPVLAEDQLAQGFKVAMMIIIPFIASMIGIMIANSM